jgi:DNA ligase (NAD+)
MEGLLEKDPSSLSIKDLEKIIDHLNKEYRYGSEIVDDEIYDEYIDALREKKPTSRFLREIGAPVRDELEKVALPLWMGSMNKVKPNSKELDRWLKKFKGPYFCSAKLDGMSCLYGKDQLYTRGDGRVGQNISYLLPYIDLPEIGDAIFVRGELIMKKSVFEKKYADDFPKARSVVAGVINSKKPNSKILKHIDFVAFEVVFVPNPIDNDDEFTASEQFDWLQDLEFNVPYNKKLESDFDTDELTPLLQEMKRESSYEVDGVIIVDDHFHARNVSDNPKYAVAYKVNAKGKETIIEDVLWEPSMYGVLKPRIHFKTVVIDGDNVSFATAFNAKYVKDNHLRRGVEVKIVKSGDVIPYIAEVINPPKKEHVMTGRKADMPNEDEVGEYEWNENEVELELIDPLDNPIVRRKRLVHFFKSLSIKYISDGVVKKFIKGGYETPEEVYHASVEDLMELDGIKEKSAQKYFDSVHSVLDHPIPIETVMKASMALGKGFGERKLFPLVSGVEMVSGKKGNYKFRRPSLDEILEIEGFSYKTGMEFRNNFNSFVKWFKANKYINLELPQSKKDEDLENSSELPLDGKIILFTGVRNKELSKKLEKLGAKIEGSFTKKVNVLVVKDKDTSNAKTQKAAKQGIPVYVIDEVEKKLIS